MKNLTISNRLRSLLNSNRSLSCFYMNTEELDRNGNKVRYDADGNNLGTWKRDEAGNMVTDEHGNYILEYRPDGQTKNIKIGFCSALYLKSEIEDTAPNYFDIRGNMVSYNLGIQEINDAGKWTRKGRQEMKLARFIRENCEIYTDVCGYNDRYNFLIDKARNRAIELFAINCAEKSYNLQISDRPSNIYPMERIENCGTLGTSCMRAVDSDYFQIYDDNSELLYAVDSENKLIGRALIWRDCKNNANGERFDFIDRIYGTEDFISYVKEYAENNGLYSKVCQSYCDATLELSGKYITDYVKEAKKDNTAYMYYPYIDTLKYLTEDYFYSSKPDGNHLECTNLDGSADRTENIHTCSECGDEINTDRDNYHSDADGNIYCASCCHYSNYHNRVIFPDDRDEYGRDYVYSDHMRDYIRQDDAFYSEYLNSYII